MGCCTSCDNGGPCDCGGNCNGSCGKSPKRKLREVFPAHDTGEFYPTTESYPPYGQEFDFYTVNPTGYAFNDPSSVGEEFPSHDAGEFYPVAEGYPPYGQEFDYYSANPTGYAFNSVMGGPLTDNIKANTKLWRSGEYLNVRYSNPNRKGSLVVSVPFAPVMAFCQNLAMLYGDNRTRPNTVMGYAPILALVTSQLASRKVVEDAAAKEQGQAPAAPNPNAPPKQNAADMGPVDLTQLLRMIPGIFTMVGLSYDEEEEPSEVASILMGQEEMGACGCGVPCDNIQPVDPYMQPKAVVRRAMPYTPYNSVRPNRFWRKAPVVNDQADNMFGRSKSPPPSATPPNGWPNVPLDIEEVPHQERQFPPMGQPPSMQGEYWHQHQHSHRTPAMYGDEVPCAKGGTCGKGCCAH